MLSVALMCSIRWNQLESSRRGRRTGWSHRGGLRGGAPTLGVRRPTLPVPPNPSQSPSSASPQLNLLTSSTCWGHKEREDRANKILKLASKPKETPDENCRVLIKKGPVSVETSLKELEEKYANKLEWKVIEDGGVLRQYPCGGWKIFLAPCG